MRPRNLMVRLFRALSGETQKAFARRTGIHHALLAQYERDLVDPSPDHLERLGQGVGLMVADGERILELADTLRKPRLRAGQGIEDLTENLTRELSSLVSGFYERMLRKPLPVGPPRADDRQRADELWRRLVDLPEDQQLTVVRMAREFQISALAERVREESVAQASRDAERSASLGRLAQEIEERACPSPGIEIPGSDAVNALSDADDGPP
jgi:transcriptional regulator with XRE-family HTH domain